MLVNVIVCYKVECYCTDRGVSGVVPSNKVFCMASLQRGGGGGVGWIW